MTCLVPVRNGPEIPNPTQKQNAYKFWKSANNK